MAFTYKLKEQASGKLTLKELLKAYKKKSSIGPYTYNKRTGNMLCEVSDDALEVYVLGVFGPPVKLISIKYDMATYEFPDGSTDRMDITYLKDPNDD